MAKNQTFELFGSAMELSQEMRECAEWLIGRLRDTEDMLEGVTLIEAAEHSMGVYTAAVSVLTKVGGPDSVAIWGGLTQGGKDLTDTIDELLQEILNTLVRLDAPESIIDQVTLAINKCYRERQDHDHP